MQTRIITQSNNARFKTCNLTNIEAIDAAAEREGAALEWMEQQLGIPRPRSALARQREAGVVMQDRYPLAASTRAHRKIAEHFAKRLRGEDSKYRFDPEICSREDRQRRIQRQVDRARLLLRLAKDRADYYPFSDAIAAAGMGARTLQRAVHGGRIGQVRLGGRCYIARIGLVSYLRAKVA